MVGKSAIIEATLQFIIWEVFMKHLLIFLWVVSTLLLGIRVSAQDDKKTYPIITAENATQLQNIAISGRGAITDTAINPTGDTFVVVTGVGLWFYALPTMT